MLLEDYLHLKRDCASLVHLHIRQKIKALLLEFFQFVLFLHNPFLVLLILFSQLFQLLLFQISLLGLILRLEFLNALKLLEKVGLLFFAFFGLGAEF